jgi:hypothetical protein
MGQGRAAVGADPIAFPVRPAMAERACHALEYR